MTDFYHIFESPDKGYFQTIVHLLYTVNRICYNLFNSIGKVRRSYSYIIYLSPNSGIVAFHVAF